MLKNLQKTFTQDHSVLSVILILLGSTLWSLTMVKSGWLYDFGYGYWGPNGHDGVWHIAVTNSLARGSWNMPIFSGEALQNYHIGFDLILSLIHKLTFIPVNNLYFQLVPPLIALGVGLSAYKLVLLMTKSKASALGAIFFVYFGGSLGWIVSFLRNQTFYGESMFWSQQSISTLINPPFALSLVVMFLGLIFLYQGVETKSAMRLRASTIFLGSLIFIKVYVGLLIIGALFIAGLFKMVKREGISLMKVWAGVVILSLILFLPLNLNSTSGVEFKPFWFLETMMAISDRVGWERYYSAMVNYKLAGNYVLLIIAYLVAFVVFIIGNFSLRLVGLIEMFNWLRKPRSINYMQLMVVSMIVAGIVMPMFFVQSGTPWNTIQFMYYSLMLMGLISGVTVGKYLEKSSNSMFHSNGFKILFVILIVLLTIPTSIATLNYHYLPSRPPAMLSDDEIAALEFLSNQDEGAVLTYPYDLELARLASDNPPRPLYLYESTSYVAAYSNHDVYLEDEVNLNITGYDWPERRKEVEEFLTTGDEELARAFLDNEDIRYIYWVGDQRALLGESQLGVKKIFENEIVNIYEVN